MSRDDTESPIEERAILDLTGLPRRQRHRTVIATLEALDPGTRLVVVNDHEPTGLRIQLQRRYEGRLRWESRGGAGGRFVVAIRLVAEPDTPLALARAAEPAPSPA
jgi:uncharacterized protein (DUF2249 family)